MAENEKPGTWEEWKAKHPRWPRLLGWAEWRLEWLVYWCRDLAIFEVLEFAGRVSVLVAVIWWFWEAGDREKQKHYRAWELINSARGSTGDGGRRKALEDLHEDGVDLNDAPLANAYLGGVQLPKATLYKADLTKAVLMGANLAGADLYGTELNEAHLAWANLSNANLYMANLSRANLYMANLHGARLHSANMTEAELIGADLTNAILAMDLVTSVNSKPVEKHPETWVNLAGANLTRANLTGAYLSDDILLNVKLCETIMPDGITNNRDCLPGDSAQELEKMLLEKMLVAPN